MEARPIRTAVAGGSLAEELKKVGATDKDIEKLGDTLDEINSDVDRFVKRAGEGAAAGIGFNIRTVQGISPQDVELSRTMGQNMAFENKQLLLRVGLQQAVNEGDKQRHNF